MSVISGSLRSASLVAAGDVHLLCLDQKSFEGLLRERPEVSLAVMRMLCERLRQVSQREDAQYN
jgi:CRP-like cAMP-binding protein